MAYGEDESGQDWTSQVTPAGPASPAPGQLHHMRGQPPGWFTDPLAPTTHQRWWTGQGWSEHTEPPSGPSLPAIEHRVVKLADRRRVGTLVRRRLLPAGLLVLLLAGVLGGVLSLLPGGMPRPGPGQASPSPTSASLSTPGQDRQDGPDGSASRPARMLPVPGIPAGAVVDCLDTPTAPASPAASSASRPSGSARSSVREPAPAVASSDGVLRCTFDGPGTAGVLTCAPLDEQVNAPASAAASTLRCAVRDASAQSTSVSDCTAAAGDVSCRPAGTEGTSLRP